MARLEGHGMTVELPTGWDGAITTRQPDVAERTLGAVETPVLHAANFALPAERGDFGSGAVEVMGRGGVLIAVLDYGPAVDGGELFRREGLPPAVQPDDFATHTLQRPQAGQGGLQVFFSQGERAYCLYVVIGSHRRRQVLTPVVNKVLAGIELP